MKTKQVSLITFLVASLTSGLPANADINIIKRNCYKKWGTNYSMVEFCIKDQLEGLMNLNRTRNSPIKSRCIDKWGENYSMIVFCIKDQSEAARRLGVTEEKSQPGYLHPSNQSSPRGGSGQNGCRSYIIANGEKHCI